MMMGSQTAVLVPLELAKNKEQRCFWSTPAMADNLLLTLAAYVRVHNAAQLRRLLLAFVDAVKKRR